MVCRSPRAATFAVLLVVIHSDEAANRQMHTAVIVAAHAFEQDRVSIFDLQYAS
jgi:hypothetical protein